jgi:hypothetical protein
MPTSLPMGDESAMSFEGIAQPLFKALEFLLARSELP